MAIRVEHDPAGSRFVAYVDDERAGFTEYSLADGVLTMPHTVTEPRFEGHGVGSAVVRTALDHAREQGLRVRPLCWFVAGWIDRHPDYADLVA
jgi:hypothetical protein